MRSSSALAGGAKPAKSSKRIVSSRVGASPSPVNRFSQMRSATRTWLSVFSSEPKKAPVGRTSSSGVSSAAAS
jgi:hypothetical protein